ncbi:hypothetical protein BAY61_26440 [Prauserella marina]|uniref:Uncharacterized protein n=1 Tax=Prauserella marina TaxID=530584 RepID=A0A222VW64_9PSEU|nr:hypothetical protein [Prauserella marina]ASR37961.1 hypothetical protein BAY61_26440 [Prauserella marina]PWV73183.1 hypothetical protein DES30_109133 [Prauserella marina]SDD69930.1 hypothetical protein SAMN05421630_111140 [Prauserella marina]
MISKRYYLAVLEDLSMSSTVARRAAYWMTEASVLSRPAGGSVSERMAQVAKTLSEADREIRELRREMNEVRPE